MDGLFKGSCLFVSDIHGSVKRFETLFKLIGDEKPAFVLIGGDILPPASGITLAEYDDFLREFFTPGLSALKSMLKEEYPSVFLILGNDDPGCEEDEILRIQNEGLLIYLSSRKVSVSGYDFYGYSYVPPSPFGLKDWEKYDVSRFVDAGCVSPEEGYRTVQVEANVIRNSTIAEDLDRLFSDSFIPEKSVLLFHSPPYQTNLDRLDNGGKMIDHAPCDNNAGSIAVRRLIEKRQPLITLHGHIHESARLTGSWKDMIGKTICLSAAHDGRELAVVRFDLDKPESAERFLL